MNKWFHIPTPFHNKKANERIYIRLEIYYGSRWASGGRYEDGTLKIYRRSKFLEFDIGYSIGKVDWSILNSEF